MISVEEFCVRMMLYGALCLTVLGVSGVYFLLSEGVVFNCLFRFLLSFLNRWSNNFKNFGFSLLCRDLKMLLFICGILEFNKILPAIFSFRCLFCLCIPLMY